MMYSFMNYHAFRETLNTIFTFLIKPREETYRAVVEHLGKIVNQPKNERESVLSRVVELLYYPLCKFNFKDLTGMVQQSYDLTSSLMLSLCDHWQRQIQDDIDLLFDQNGHLKKIENKWNKIVKSTNKIEIGYDRRKLSFPPKIRCVSFLKSTDSLGIQVADILAGAYAELFTSLANRNAEEKDVCCNNKDACPEVLTVARRYMQGNVVFVIWPGKEVTPLELDCIDNSGTDFYDGLADILHQ